MCVRGARCAIVGCASDEQSIQAVSAYGKRLSVARDSTRKSGLAGYGQAGGGTWVTLAWHHSAIDVRVGAGTLHRQPPKGSASIDAAHQAVNSRAWWRFSTSSKGWGWHARMDTRRCAFKPQRSLRTFGRAGHSRLSAISASPWRRAKIWHCRGWCDATLTVEIEMRLGDHVGPRSRA